MANEKITYKLDVDASDATAEFKKVAAAADQAGDKIGKAFSDGAKDAGRDIDALMAKIDKLGAGRAANLILSNNFKQIESDLVDLSIKLDALDADDPEVEVTLANIGQLEGDLDRITGKIKELNATEARIEVTADTSGVSSGLDDVNTKLDKTRAGADQSKSVLANMVGNTAQDVGELGGAIGSTGVLIGQFAEQAAEGSISLANFAKVAGPAGLLTALSVGVGLFTKWKAAQAEIAENTRQMTEAFQEGVGSADDWKKAVDDAFTAGGSSADKFSEQILSGLEKALDKGELNDFLEAIASLGLSFEDLGQLANTAAQDFESYSVSAIDAHDATSNWGSVLGPMIDTWGSADEVLHRLNNQVQAGAPLLDEYGNAIPIDEVIAWVEANGPFLDSLDEVQEGLNKVDIEDAAKKFLNLESAVSPATAALVTFARAQTENADGTVNETAALGMYIDMLQRRSAAETRAAANQAAADAARTRHNEEIGRQRREAEAELDRMTFTSEELQAALAALADPLQTMPDLWNILIESFRAGGVELENSAGVINTLAAATHLEPGDILTIVADQAHALDDAATEATAALAEAGAEIANIVNEVPDIAAALSTEFDKVDKLFSGLAFDVDFQPSLNKALDELHGFNPDLQTLADEWSNILTGKEINIFGNVRADDDEFMEKIGNLRELFQTGVVNAFEQGGVDAANTFVQSTAAQIAASTGLPISEVYRIMGLPPDGTITTLIAPEIEQQHAEQAKAILDSIAGTGVDDPRIVALQVALDAGQIDGDIAYIASLLIANEMGIPVELGDIPPEDIAAAEALLAETPVTLATTVDPAGAQDGITEITDGSYTANVATDADPSGARTAMNPLTNEGTNPVARVYTIANVKDARTAIQDLASNFGFGYTADVNAYATQDYLNQANYMLDLVSRDRTADINAELDRGDVAAIEVALAILTRERDAKINVITTNRTITTQSLGTPGGPSPTPSLAPTAMAFAGEDVGINPLTEPATSVVTYGTPVSVAGPVASPTIHNHVTISAAVIGSRFDVQRAVTKALRQSYRLAGSRT